jgi:hypothetical protein
MQFEELLVGDAAFAFSTEESIFKFAGGLAILVVEYVCHLIENSSFDFAAGFAPFAGDSFARESDQLIFW